MWRVTWRGLLAHKLRLALTGFAVVLGVAFVAGSLILTDTMRDTFEDVVRSTAGGVDVQVRGIAAFTGQFADDSERPPVPPELLEVVEAVDGVRVASPAILGYAQLIDRDGQPIGGLGPPTLGANAPVEEGLGGLTIRDGRLPQVDGEVAIDAFTADVQGFDVGDRVRLLTPAGPEEAEIVGIAEFGGARNLAGATVTIFDLETATRRLATDGYDAIEVYAADGVDHDQLAAAVSEVVGGDYEVLTAQTLVDESLEQIGQILDIFGAAMLVFAGVSLFVGAFIIFNSFAIIVAQRTRELALLRAIGAGRRQVLATVVTEAAATGLLASAVGVVAGIGLAVVLRGFMAAIGMELPAGTLAIRPSAVTTAFVVGVVVTVAAALAPAMRATRVAPVEALQAVAAPPAPRFGRTRYVIGAVGAVIGLALLAFGVFGGGGLPLVGTGVAVTFLGVTALSPLVARPIVAVLGAPVARLRGVTGALARDNAMRNPRRTASTAAALMIGLGLVGFTVIFAASLRASSSAAIDELFLADFQIRSSTFTGLSPDVGDAVAALDEVALVSRQQFGELRVGDATSTTFAMSVDPATTDEVFRLDVLEGSTADLAGGGLVVSERLAQRNGWSVGERVPVEFGLTGATTLPLVGIFDGAGVDIQVVLDADTFAANFRTRQDFAVLVRLADGVAADAGRAALERAVADHPTANVQDQQAFREEVGQNIDQLLALVFGLLFLSVLIALFGIVNTLALSVLERIREIGLLRAIGATRPEIRAMVRWESVLVAVLGAVLGLAVGVVFAWIVVTSLSDLGLGRFVVPVDQLAIAVLVAGLAGVLAGALPARRAARIDVLRAITVE